MIRMRGVKPDLLRHEQLCDQEASCGLPLRLCFIALFMATDRRGRFEWRPRSLKAALMPFDDGLDFSAVLDQLSTGDFVRRYTVDGKDYGWIPGFTRHQSFNNKEQDSVFPPHPDEPRDSGNDQPQKPRVPDACATRDLRHLEASASRNSRHLGKGKERKEKGEGREVNVSPDGDTPTQDFHPSEPDPFEDEKVRAAARIVNRYPRAGGDGMRAQLALVQSLLSGATEEQITAGVAAHAAAFRRLPASLQHFCPGRQKYFESEEWSNSAMVSPWIDPDASPSDSAPKKNKSAAQQETEARRMAIAREMWPELAEFLPWESLSPEQRLRVQQEDQRREAERRAAA